MKISFQHVHKQYKKTMAVNDLSVELEEGIYGLLGPNGAGKSTLMKLMVGNLKTTSGTILCDDREILSMGKSYREMIGYMPQQQEMYPYFTGRRFLRYMATLKGLQTKDVGKEIERVAESVNLLSVLNHKIGSYSGGMKQRLLIAQALLGNPKILIMDEPTAGLDPKERIRIRNLISENAQDKIVFIATHVVQDIEFIAKEIIMMKKGEIIAMGDSDSLLKDIADKVYETELPIQQAEDFIKTHRVSNVAKVGDMARIRFVLRDKELIDGDATLVVPEMEDYYLYLYDDSAYLKG